MVVMTGTKKVLHLIGIQCFIHRDREYILYGRFIEDREVSLVFRFQFIIHNFQLVAVVYDRLPGIEFITVYHELDIFSVGTFVVRPVVIGINFGIQCQFCQQESNHRTSDTPIIRPGLIAVYLRK